MTRFFKVSLSVVALLLVSLLVFTGCNNEGADQALAAAEEAKQAVTTATADLEAAIANKADATKLAEEVDALTKAIQAAELLAEDGDSSLKAAVATAKAALTENAQTIVNALDVKIAGLLAEKSDKATVDAELARFEEVIKNINDATGAYIKLNDFVSFSSQAAIHAYQLEQKFYRMAELSDLYGEDWENIEKAYAIAKVVIYRATSIEVVNSALAQFDKTVMDNANEIDIVYYDYILAYQNGDLDNAELVYKKAAAAFAKALGTEGVADEALVTDYYGNGNLVLTALKLWRESLTADMKAIGALYVVNPENKDYKDADYIAKTETSKANFATAVAVCDGWFGDIETLAVPKAYTDNVARVALLANAKKDADAVIKLGAKYVEKYKKAALKQDNIDALAAWKGAYDKWVGTYLPELQKYQKDNEESQARYEAVAALISATEKSLDANVAALAEKTADFVAGANTAFVDSIKASFYDKKTSTALDLKRVDILSGDAIASLKKAAAAWAKENNANLVIPAFAYADAKVVRPNEAYANVAVIEANFNEKTADFVAKYSALPHDAAKAAIKAGKINMYDESAAKILALAGNLAWGDATKVTLPGKVTVEKSYIEKLAALEASRAELIKFVQTKNDAIDAAVKELAGVKTVDAFNKQIAALEKLVKAYENGNHSDLPKGVTKDQVAYVAANTNKGKLADGTKFDLTLDVVAMNKTAQLAYAYADLSDSLIALNALKTNDKAPYFDNNDKTDVTDAVTYNKALSKLITAYNTYVAVAGDKADETLVYNADVAIVYAQVKIETTNG